MKYEVKVYKRLGALIGSFIGIFAMITAICLKKNLLGAILLIIFACVGLAMGCVLEKIMNTNNFTFVRK